MLYSKHAVHTYFPSNSYLTRFRLYTRSSVYVTENLLGLQVPRSARKKNNTSKVALVCCGKSNPSRNANVDESFGNWTESPRY